MSLSLVQTAPRFHAAQVHIVVQELYGLSVTAEPLPSERDQNFLCTTQSGDRYVLKIANSAESL
ncbi:MAG: hypothetical protein JO041_15175, partial [Acidobacteria bacterium]|nr:hypothetical protein [Acidobacteriota bacterium]